MERSALLLLILTAFITPTIFLFARQSVQSNRNQVTDWLPKSYEETKQLVWFRQFFVGDQFIVISWDGCELGNNPEGKFDDPRIQRLAKALMKVQLTPRDGSKPFHCFKAVTAARDVLNVLTSPPTELSYKAAVERLIGTLIGPDRRQTCLIATLADPSIYKMREVIGRSVHQPLKFRERTVSPLFQAIKEAGVPEQIVHLGGPPVDNVAIDEEGERTLVRLAGLSGALGIGLAWWSLRSIRMTAVIFFCAIFSSALALAAVPLSGDTMDAILMSMPALIYVLAISGAIHYLNYYRQAVAESGLEGAVRKASIHAWKPAILCNVTTAIGLLSLYTSDITPIRKYGLYSALGVILTIPVLFAVLSSFLRLWPWQPMPADSAPVKRLKASSSSPASSRHGWLFAVNFIQRRYLLVLATCLGAIGLLCCGLPQVTTSIDILKLFNKEAVLLQDYAWLESHLGKLIPMELVVRFPREAQQEHLDANAPLEKLVRTHSFLERMEFVERVERSIERNLGADGEGFVGATMSAATMARTPGGPGVGLMRWSERNVTNNQLIKHRDAIESTGFLRTDERTGEELWRITVRVAAFHNIDHGKLVQHLRKVVEPVFSARQTYVATMEALLRRQGNLPNGARIVVWSPGGLTQIDHDLGALLASKRILAIGIKDPLEKIPPKKLAQISLCDGVVPGSQCDMQDMQQAKQHGLPLLTAPLAGDLKVSSDGTDVGVVYTGVIPIVYKAQRALLDSLIQSTWWSFASITPLIMFVCRSILGGMVVMLPNVLPVLVVFGGMGWLGIPVDIGSMMAASIALGVAVDDTIHFLAWFRADYKDLNNSDAAVVSAYGRSATPALQAALVSGLGLSVFAASSFTPTQRFGWLMLTILSTGIVAELIMCPALLFSPLGRLLTRPSTVSKIGHWSRSRLSATKLSIKSRMACIYSRTNQRGAARIPRENVP